MKKLDNTLMISFHFINLILISLYLYPGSIFGHVVYGDLTIQPQITRDFVISSNHFYAFFFYQH